MAETSKREARCPNYIPVSLRCALKSLSLPGSKMAVKKMQSWGVLTCTVLTRHNKHAQSLHIRYSVVTAAGGDIPSSVTRSNVLASHCILWGSPHCTNDVPYFLVHCMNFAQAAKWLAFVNFFPLWEVTKNLDYWKTTEQSGFTWNSFLLGDYLYLFPILFKFLSQYKLALRVDITQV